MSAQADDEWIRKIIAEELTPQGDLLPPWVRCPRLPRYSIGWRMGGGEAYLLAWRLWAKDKKPEQFVEYFKRYLPLPFVWVDFVADSLDLPGVSVLSNKVNTESVRRLEELGLIGFAEFMDWVRNLPADFAERRFQLSRLPAAARE